jgi:hypothetical protein
MRMQEGGQAMTREQAAEILMASKEGLPFIPGNGNFNTNQVDLGGGLGAIPGLQLDYSSVLEALKNQQFGIPTVFTDPVEEEEVVDEVVEEEEEDIAPVMPVAPVKDPVVEVVSEEVAEEVAPTPTPAPVPVVDTSGIGTLPQVVLPPADAEDMNLITGTDAPLTEEEIFNVATPTMTPTTGADIARLNQQYNDTFLKMLVQDPVAPVGPPQTQPVYGPGGNQGVQGEQSGLIGGESINRYAQNPNSSYMSPGITGTGAGGASMQDMFNNYGNYQQTYSTPADVQFQMDSIFGNGFTNNNNNINNQNFNNPYEQYGNLAFPTFGSGVTSLVPPDTMYNLK